MNSLGSIKTVLLAMAMVFVAQDLFGQIDPFHRNLLQFGYDQPLTGHGPHGIYMYYYYNNPEIRGTNTALRAAIAPAYLDGELGFKELLSPYTDFGIGIYGGAFSDNYYEVRQGKYYHEESFDGYGGGSALSIYQLLNPGMLIPVSLVARAGARYTTYDGTSKTAPDFVLPDSRVTPFVRVGVRMAGKEPVLYADLGLELSAWFEHQWRTQAEPYGYSDDRTVSANAQLYWLYAGLNYAWTNTGHKILFAAILGGSTDADRFSAWRPGGVLPLNAEFPLMLPGYYYQELTAERVAYLFASYLITLDKAKRFQFGIEAASAKLEYLPGFEQPSEWQTGVGCSLTFTPKRQICRIVLRYGYGFNAIRDNEEGGHSVGLLLQYDFEQHLKYKRGNK